MQWLKQCVAIYMVGMLCSEGAIWAVQCTVGEGQLENIIQPLQGTWAPVWGPHTGKGVWLLGGSSSSKTGGDQAGRTLLPPILGPLPDSGSGLCRFAGAWSWCCSPWPPVLPVLGPGAADPGPVSCSGTGVLLLLSAPKDLRTVPENAFPPYGSCVDQTNTF